MIAAAAVLNQTPLDWEGNHRRIVRAIRLARRHRAGLLLLPELAISGFGAGNHFRRKQVRERSEEMLVRLLDQTQGIAVLVGFPVAFREKTYNALAWIENGTVEFVHCKTCLRRRFVPEDNWFTPWNPGVIEFSRVAGQPVPFGDFTNFEQPFPTTGSLVRFHVRFGEEEFEFRDDLRANIVLQPGANPFSFGKHALRREFIRSVTREKRCAWIYADGLGCESGRFVYDGGGLIASSGTILAQSRRFSCEEVRLAVAPLPVTPHCVARDDVTQNVVVAPDNVTQTNVAPERCAVEAMRSQDSPDDSDGRCDPVFTTDAETVPLSREEEFSYMVPLALFDYMRKTKSCGFVLSLSGGADSASLAVLVAYMVRFAWQELGKERFREKLDFFPEIQNKNTPAEAFRDILACVYQKTKHNTQTTRHAAETLAQALGAHYFEIDIDPMVEAYQNAIAQHFPRDVSWETDDRALQNIQARARGPGIWFLANLRGAILLNTGNRSEATLGYTTMDGDTCGGLAPIGGVDKAFLRRWLTWAEHTGPDGFAIPELKLVNEQRPTAELRPPERGQTDEDDLMPYEVLNRFEQLIVRDGLSRAQAVEMTAQEFEPFSRKQLLLWAERFTALWTRNQWKRTRYAPAFHLDDDTLLPDDWERYPFFIG